MPNKALNTKGVFVKNRDAGYGMLVGRPVTNRYEAESTAAQTVINLSFSVETSKLDNFMLFIDGVLLQEGVSSDYTFTSIVGGTSNQITLNSSIIAGLNIVAVNLGNVLSNVNTTTLQSDIANTRVKSWENMTTTDTAQSTYDGAYCDTASGSYTVTMYTAVGNAGREYSLRKTTSDGNTVTVEGKVLNRINEEIKFRSDGTNWIVVDWHRPLAKPAKVKTNDTTAILSGGGANTRFIGFTTTVHDEDSLFSLVNTSNQPVHTDTTHWTAPWAGYFEITAQLYTNDTDLDVSENLDLYITKNGSGTVLQRNINVAEGTLASVSKTLFITTKALLAKDDKISIFFLHNCVDPLSLAATADLSYFEVIEIPTNK